MGETIYFNKGQKRKKQIYNLFVENIEESAVLSSKFGRVVNLLAVGEVNNSTREFKNLVGAMEETTIVGYLMQENYGFGKDRIILDMYSGVLSGTLRKLRKRTPSKIHRVETQEVEEIEEELKEDKREFIFGINPEGKRKKAVFKRIVVKGKPQTRIVDAKTKRYLRPTKEFKEEHKENKNV